MELTKAEEQLMEHLWKLEKAFMRDLLEAYGKPEPKPTTIATLLKRMTNKGYITYKLYGNSREYIPLIQKEDYFSKKLNRIIKRFFNDSLSQFASFFSSKMELTEDELKNLRSIVDNQIEKQRHKK